MGSIFTDGQFRFLCVFAFAIAILSVVGHISLMARGGESVVQRSRSIVAKENKSVSAPAKKDTIDAGKIARELKIGKIDLNSATVNELTKLPGVGRTLANRIVKYRDERGKFKSVDELINVKGIGKKKLNRIRKLVEVH